jgi:hypothetical protein
VGIFTRHDVFHSPQFGYKAYLPAAVTEPRNGTVEASTRRCCLDKSREFPVTDVSGRYSVTEVPIKIRLGAYTLFPLPTFIRVAAIVHIPENALKSWEEFAEQILYRSMLDLGEAGRHAVEHPSHFLLVSVSVFSRKA